MADFSFCKGEDALLTLTVEDADGVAVDVTGFTTVLTVKTEPTDAVALLAKTGTVIDGPNGKITYSFASADTLTLAARTYVADVQRTDSGFVTQLWPAADEGLGYLRLLQEVRNP